MSAVTTLDFEATSKYLEGDYRIHYHEAGDGPALVLLHGSGPGVSGWSNFRGNFPVFAGQFRTVVMDMPGFGRSERPELDRAYPRVAADGLARLLDGLGIERAHLLGNSMGGYVGLEFALAYPDRVNRMVLMGPGGLAVNVLGPDPSEGARRLGEFMMAPSKAAMEAWVDTMVANKAVVDDGLIEERLANAMAPGALESAIAIFSSLGQHPEPVPMFARLKGIKVPTLVTWGRDDRMLPVEGALMGFRQLPNAELHIFSRCGHWAQVERKDDFERLVVEFLTRD
ncbi:MAG TPA: alpha/beta fold hydrolase [Acidimicrobiales bacterium]|nr:alpha/beta fold hydrolase [Acidimicrobiales bacterium]